MSHAERGVNVQFHSVGLAVTAVVEPHSNVLRAHSLLEHTDATVKLDNKVLHDNSHRNLDIERFTYTNLNLFARADHLLVDSTSSFQRNAERGQHGNPDAFPGLPAHSVHALQLQALAYHEQMSVADVAMFVFQPAFMMCKCDPTAVSKQRAALCTAVMLYRRTSTPRWRR